MSNYVLKLNEEAVKALGPDSRLRVRVTKRGGIDYLGLRSSYRVAGFNSMIRVEKHEDGTGTAILPKEFIEREGVPAPQAGVTYGFYYIGYKWFLLRQMPLKDGTPAIAVELEKQSYPKNIIRITTQVEVHEASLEA